MEIVPVIDLLQGNVVRAQRGERHRYLPIRSTLCDTSDPFEVVGALLGLYPFKSLYIADLDAIQGRGSHGEMVSALKNAYPTLQFWLDNGISAVGHWPFKDDHQIRCVLGSENQANRPDYLALRAYLESHQPILSLDFSTTGFMGPVELLDPTTWPDTLICMTLAKVGSYEGPDFNRLAELGQKSEGRAIYAAGGIRGVEDLERLQSAGVTGALLASSLHDGRIAASDIDRLMQ